jgi:hypothetical protein
MGRVVNARRCLGPMALPTPQGPGIARIGSEGKAVCQWSATTKSVVLSVLRNSWESDAVPAVPL